MKPKQPTDLMAPTGHAAPPADGAAGVGAGAGFAPGPGALSEKQVARLSVYRRLLQDRPAGAAPEIYSHELAALTRNTAAQVRRDLMSIGFTGSPARGYRIEQLIEAIGRTLDAPAGQGAALCGVGNLGRALLDYFTIWRPQLRIVAAFDTDPAKTGRVIHRCRVYPLAELEQVVREQGISVGVITVPAASAQRVAESMLAAGIRGFLNFAPTPLHLPDGAYVEEMDITTSMEKVAYFARTLPGPATTGKP